MAAIDIVHELPNPYDRLKLEIVGSCFALHPAKRSSLSTGSKQKLAPIASRISGSNPIPSAIITSQMALSRDFAARKLEEFAAF